MIENDSFKTDLYIYIKISKTIDNICDEDPAYKLYIYTTMRATNIFWESRCQRGHGRTNGLWADLGVSRWLKNVKEAKRNKSRNS